MEAGELEELGFKCGLEIHQQVEGKKLFCNCPGYTNKQEQPDYVIKRKLRPSSGELGSIDKAAAYELTKKKYFEYEAYQDCNCLVDIDCEPPHHVNTHALQTAIQVAKLLHADLVDEIQVMRKIVIDGSNVSGFQRTMLIGVNGYVDTSRGRVGIQSICLEEESAKKIKENDDHVVYRLDRLGIPLIEIATEASITSPEHCKEVAGIIGMILRSTGSVKRGLGTIRQDVNVSIKGHPRIEIKGFQDLRSIPKIIEYEITRQLAETQQGKKIESHVRKAEPDLTTSYLRPMPGAARMYPETDVQPLTLTRDFLNTITVPELLTEKTLNIEKMYGVNETVAREILDNELFFKLVDTYKNVPSHFIAKLLVEMPKDMKKRLNIDPSTLKEKDYEFILDQYEKKKINDDAAFNILCDLAQGKEINVEQYKQASTAELEHEIRELVATQKGVSINGLMGIVMKKYRGRIDGKEVMRILKKYAA